MSKKRFGSIYMITNLLTNKKYIGQTKNTVLGRFNDHCRDKRSSRYLSSSIQVHGRENFKVEELIVCFNETDLNFMETYFIELYDTLHPSGYNLSKGGHVRGIISEKTREKMRMNKLGKKVKRTKTWSEDSRKNMSLVKGGRPVVATNITTGEIRRYDFISQAEKDGFSNGDIYRVLRGERKTCKGFHFKYVNDINQSGSLETKNS